MTPPQVQHSPVLIEFVQEGQATTKYISEADFANLIVKAMEQRYGADKVERVVKSFRQVPPPPPPPERGYPHCCAPMANSRKAKIALFALTEGRLPVRCGRAAAATREGELAVG